MHNGLKKWRIKIKNDYLKYEINGTKIFKKIHKNHISNIYHIINIIKRRVYTFSYLFMIKGNILIIEYLYNCRPGLETGINYFYKSFLLNQKKRREETERNKNEYNNKLSILTVKRKINKWNKTCKKSFIL